MLIAWPIMDVAPTLSYTESGRTGNTESNPVPALARIKQSIAFGNLLMRKLTRQDQPPERAGVLACLEWSIFIGPFIPPIPPMFMRSGRNLT